MNNSIIRKILAMLLFITMPIVMVAPVFQTGSISVASSASSSPTVTIDDIPDYINSLPTITGTSTDTSPGTISKVQIQVINQSDNIFWDGSSWQALFNLPNIIPRP